MSEELKLAVPSSTTLFAIRGVDGSHDAKFVESIALDWAEKCDNRSSFSAQLGDIIRVRTAVDEDNALLSKLDDSLARITEKHGIEKIATQVFKVTDRVIARLEEAPVLSFVAGGIIEAGQLLLASSELIATVATHKLPFKMDLVMERLVTDYAERMHEACMSETAGLEFLGWVTRESAAVGETKERIDAMRPLLGAVNALRKAAIDAGVNPDDAALHEGIEPAHNCDECAGYDMCQLPIKKPRTIKALADRASGEGEGGDGGPETETETETETEKTEDKPAEETRTTQGGAFEANDLFDPRLLGGNFGPIH